jgi:hypothetical protein
MNAVDSLAILYLALPVALFFFTWFKPIFGIPFGLAGLAGLAVLWPLPKSKMPARTLAFAAILALLWSSLSGASHFFNAGAALNWPIRDAVLRDMVLFPGPIVYRLQDGLATILRAPIAYYMVPAMLGRIVGVQYASFLLYLWTAAGVLLFLLQVLAGEQRWKPLLLIAAVVILFSGMDILDPSAIFRDPASHAELPASFYQSTYNANLLIGFPNHAVPGWLATALIYRCRDDVRFLRVAAWVGALTLLWAPLVSIGLLPFFAALAWQHFRKGSWRPLFSVSNLIAAPLVVLPAALYLTAAAGTIRDGMPPPAVGPEFLAVYAMFMVVEFGALALAIVYAHRQAMDPVFFGFAVVFLLLLPWFHFGPNDDLVNRGSIPALSVIMFAVIDGWARPAMLLGRSLIVTLMLIVGSVLPVARMVQALAGPSWKPDIEHSLYDVTGAEAPNYLADIPQGALLARLLDAAAAIPVK